MDGWTITFATFVTSKTILYEWTSFIETAANCSQELSSSWFKEMLLSPQARSNNIWIKYPSN